MNSNRHTAFAVAWFLGLGAVARADVDSSGSFNHSIDIRLPAAVGGTKPDIRLSYSSNAGNGLAGVGWDLDGLPIITRMSYGAGINYNGGDTFVGPGGRLVNLQGRHVYHTEEESWAKHVPYKDDGSMWTGTGGCGGGPCYWTVTQPDGDVHTFGASSDSRIEAVGRGGAVRVWALTAVVDTAGNGYRVSYAEDTSDGDYYPISVTYNMGNGRTQLHSVEFAYETRNDRTREYLQGAPVVMDARLKWISVRSGAATAGDAELIRKYRLDYEYGGVTGESRLTAVQEYGRGNVRPSRTLPPQTFSYQEGQFNWSAYADFPHWGPTMGYVSDAIYPTLTGDWNGDGKTDIGRVHSVGTVFQVSTGAGWQAYADGPQWSPSNGYTNGDRYPVLTGDWNGDELR